MRSIFLAVLGLMATSSLAAPRVAAQEGISAFDAMAKLKSVPLGYVHIADDGVARAYDENESVIDYVPLTNDQLKHLLQNLPEAWKKEEDHLHAVFDAVDGREANLAPVVMLVGSWAAGAVRRLMLPYQEEEVFAFSEKIGTFLLPYTLPSS
ncbi:hypothetical protein AN0005.2 [Aspergillus nidulans FGSC A4]|uniref:protein lbuA n=1 Tax=Emericella nidulans (strain FGSC A4 / ATCC 38163 / CBS 112.46 / NRRL 194 / M139) TaxID=227321 RepID=UPI0000236232|nr:protein lbuA [Aspergillus nidulans FGSC A4]EAA65324.1 hypothetical protein AN0005.2 [Aspergillus nidulans FGSC A4]CBF90399.1 TPA: conserved hypothetical protein [Aspergillus nidulans FGSC A4]|eukprot:XP_657609.1 hypothetical protein AN0005.2 [Aspergillus nidulans FGSC A4]